MKRFQTWVGSFLLVFCGVCFSLGAVISGYDFTLEICALIIVWILAALVLTALAVFFRGRGLLASLPLIMAVLFFKRDEITAGGKWVVFSITEICGQWFKNPVLFQDANWDALETTVFFAASGIALAFLLSVAVCLWRSAAFTCLFTLPAASVSVLLVGYIADSLYLIGLTAVCLTMIVSSSLHPENLEKRAAAAFPALAFACMLLGAAYLAAPPGQYFRDERVSSVERQIRSFLAMEGTVAERLGFERAGPFFSGWSYNTKRVSIADSGRRIVTGKSILEVEVDLAGTHYLRGYSMQSFDGRSWEDNSDLWDMEYLSSYMPATIIRQYNWLSSLAAPGGVHAEMAISKTGDISDVVYRPYYSFGYAQEDPNVVHFLHTERSALLAASPFAAESFQGIFSVDPADYNNAVHEIYTQISPTTKEGLGQLASSAGIYPGNDRAAVADQVASLVSSSASYSLTPSAIPENEDFALYFLSEAERGYCVHFATAATLMLRALDIPARYTVGFVVTVNDNQAGETVVVTDSSAHAWVEVYYDNLGWVPLEATPSSLFSAAPERLTQSAATGTGAPEALPGVTDDLSLAEQPNNAPITSPGGAAHKPDAPDSAETKGSALPNIFIAVLCLAAFAAALVLRRRLALAHRARMFAGGNTNEVVIFAWRYISRLHGQNRPPQEIEELALKARFSRHTLSEEERSFVIEYAAGLSEETDRRLKPLGRFLLRYVRGLY